MNALKLRNLPTTKGSMLATAREHGRSLAETFLGVGTIILMDVSGSMHAQDTHTGQSRWELAADELAQLQENLPGKIALVCFSDITTFCPSGMPVGAGGGTMLAEALETVKVADVPGVRFIVISDGQPQSPERALTVASTFRNKIDVIYVGPEERPMGRDFLHRLAQASGGITVTADKVKALAETATRMIAATA